MMSDSIPPEFMTNEQLNEIGVGIYDFARLTGHSVRHVYESIRLGKLIARKVRGKWWIARTELGKWRDNHKKENENETSDRSG